MATFYRKSWKKRRMLQDHYVRKNENGIIKSDYISVWLSAPNVTLLVLWKGNTTAVFGMIYNLLMLHAL